MPKMNLLCLVNIFEHFCDVNKRTNAIAHIPMGEKYIKFIRTVFIKLKKQDRLMYTDICFIKFCHIHYSREHFILPT